MANKHKHYAPQVRNRKTTSGEVTQSPEVEHPEPVRSYEDLVALLEIPRTPEESDTWDSVGAYICLRNAVLVEDSIYDAFRDDVNKSLVLDTANAFITFDRIALSEGLDVVENSNAVREATVGRKRSFFREMTSEAERAVVNSQDELDGVMSSSFMAISAAFSINQRMANDAVAETVFSDAMLTSLDVTDEQKEAMLDFAAIHYAALADNPARVRRQMAGVIKALRDPETRQFLAHAEHELEAVFKSMTLESSNGALADGAEAQEMTFLGQEVDFTILPRGTDVRKYTEDLISELSFKERECVDIKRVGVLEALREELGPERTYYVHGIPSQDRESGVRRDYIGLVVQTHDRAGKVVLEDAIAVSPLERRNAGYIFRQDYSTHTSWRETLSQSKDVARSNGARPLKFTEVQDRDKYEAYVGKALELLTCPPEKFSPDYNLYFQKSSNEYVLRLKPTAKIGSRALRASLL